MSTFNKVIIVGFLGADPETKVFEGGGQITNMTVASTETWKDKQTGEKKSLTEWSRVTLRNKTAELAQQYLKKGSKVLIEGKLRTRKWTDNANVDHYTTEIHANNMVFMGTKADGQQSTTAPAAAHQATPLDNLPNKTTAADNEPDDLPF